MIIGMCLDDALPLLGQWELIQSFGPFATSPSFFEYPCFLAQI